MLSLGNRRFALLMVIAVVAVASCVKDTLKETNNGSAIDFRVAAHTRAVEKRLADITSFYVTARADDAENNYFTDVEYQRSTSDNFVSIVPYFWPVNTTLNFYAYSPSLNNFGQSAQIQIDNNARKITNFTVADTFAGQEDFLVATASGTKQSNENIGVGLEFQHKLAQIEVHARNSNTGYVYKVNGVGISGVASKAAFNFSPTELSPEWIIDETEEPLDIKETYSDARELSVFSTNIMGTGGNAMLIPQNLENTEAYIAVCVQIKTKDGALVYPRPTTDNLISAEYEWVYVPIDTEWESGYRYVYTLDFTNGAGIDEDGVPVLGGDISFTVEKVKSWNEATSDQSITRLLIGTWELERVEINRTYHSDGRVVQTVLEGDGLDDEYEVMQAFRTLRCYSDSEYYIYPGVENYETKLNYTIENGYFKLFGVVNNDGEPVTDLLIREISKTSLVYTLEYVNEWNVKQYVNYFKRIEDIPILAEKAANDNVE